MHDARCTMHDDLFLLQKFTRSLVGKIKAAGGGYTFRYVHVQQFMHVFTFLGVNRHFSSPFFLQILTHYM